jgi:hypothetical protein
VRPHDSMGARLSERSSQWVHHICEAMWPHGSPPVRWDSRNGEHVSDSNFLMVLVLVLRVMVEALGSTIGKECTYR